MRRGNAGAAGERAQGGLAVVDGIVVRVRAELGTRTVICWSAGGPVRVGGAHRRAVLAEEVLHDGAHVLELCEGGVACALCGCALRLGGEQGAPEVRVFVGEAGEGEGVLWGVEGEEALAEGGVVVLEEADDGGEAGVEGVEGGGDGGELRCGAVRWG